MRFPAETLHGHPGCRLATLCLVLLSSTTLAACGSIGGPPPLVSSLALPNGPQADYPLTIGDPYSIGDVTYRPSDTLNYDEVGYAAVGTGEGITGAHHTLPVPSYAEVTSLETGRTILVRLERRGPMDSNHLVALSPRAMAQLGGSQNTAVRVRRVNAPENQRALLRSGEEAPLRMDTPRGLVEVLRRRLPAAGSASLAGGVVPVGAAPAVVAVESAPGLAIADQGPAPLDTSPMSVPTPIASAELEPSRAAAVLSPPVSAIEAAFGLEAEAVVAAAREPAQPASTPASRAIAARQGFMVQVGAFAVSANARRAAGQVNGQVSPQGALYRVRTGPFATRAEAEASLANVRAAGYSDARIYNGG